MVWIRIEIVATIDQTAEIGLKKLIKSQFESDLDPILAGGRSNCISLLDKSNLFRLKHQYEPGPASSIERALAY